MTPEELQRLEYLEDIVSSFMLQDRLYSQKDFQLADGRSIILGGGVGTKIGQSTSKIGVYGATPVVKANAISAPSSPGGTYSSSDLTSTNTAVNALRIAIKNFGITA